MRRSISGLDGILSCRDDDIYILGGDIDFTAKRVDDDLAISFSGGRSLTLSGLFRKRIAFLDDGEEMDADEFLSRHPERPAEISGRQAAIFDEADSGIEPVDAIRQTAFAENEAALVKLMEDVDNGTAFPYLSEEAPPVGSDAMAHALLGAFGWEESGEAAPADGKNDAAPTAELELPDAAPAVSGKTVANEAVPAGKSATGGLNEAAMPEMPSADGGTSDVAATKLPVAPHPEESAVSAPAVSVDAAEERAASAEPAMSESPAEKPAVGNEGPAASGDYAASIESAAQSVVAAARQEVPAESMADERTEHPEPAGMPADTASGIAKTSVETDIPNVSGIAAATRQEASSESMADEKTEHPDPAKTAEMSSGNAKASETDTSDAPGDAAAANAVSPESESAAPDVPVIHEKAFSDDLALGGGTESVLIASAPKRFMSASRPAMPRPEPIVATDSATLGEEAMGGYGMVAESAAIVLAGIPEVSQAGSEDVPRTAVNADAMDAGFGDEGGSVAAIEEAADIPVDAEPAVDDAPMSAGSGGEGGVPGNAAANEAAFGDDAAAPEDLEDIAGKTEPSGDYAPMDTDSEGGADVDETATGGDSGPENAADVPENETTEGGEPDTPDVPDGDGAGTPEDAIDPAPDAAPEGATRPVEEGQTRVMSLIDLPKGSTVSRIVYGGKYGHVEEMDGQWLYVLDTAVDKGQATDQLILLIRDAKGNSRLARISVDIIDDVARAENDFASIDETGISVGGDVLANDRAGADGLGSFEWLAESLGSDGVLRGDYGFFILDADGKWEYHLDRENLKVLELRGADGDRPADTVTERVSYMITDGDGDTSEAVLEVTIRGESGDPDITARDNIDPESGEASLVFHEKSLGSGSDPDGGALSASGEMELKAPDGIASISIGDLYILLDGTPAEMDILGGRLVLSYERTDMFSGILRYEFTLSEAIAHDAQSEDALEETLSVMIRDHEGKDDSAKLHIKVVDDVPEISAGQDAAMTGGQTVELSGFAFAFNADGPGRFEVTVDGEARSFGSVEEIDVRSSHGRLFWEDGKLLYAADPLGPDQDDALDFFTLAVIDSDGDRAEAGWSATISKPSCSLEATGSEALSRVSFADNGDGTFTVRLPQGFRFEEGGPVSENNAGEWIYSPDGTFPALLDGDGKAFQISFPDGAAVPGGAMNAIAVPEGFEIMEVVSQGAHGRIESVGGKWIYVNDGAIDSGEEQGRNLVAGADSAVVLVRDTDGNLSHVRVDVSLIDDIPELAVGGHETVDGGKSVEGTAGWDFGADGSGRLEIIFDGVAHEFSGESVSVAGKWGTLAVSADGSWTYQANSLLASQLGGKDEFSFRIVDADGDIASANADGEAAKLEFDVKRPDGSPAAATAEADEDALESDCAVSVPEGWILDRILEDDGDHPGHLAKTEGGQWIYVLDRPIDSGDAQGNNVVGIGDEIRVMFKDADGNEFESSVVVSIRDSAPDAADDAKDITEGGGRVDGDVLANDSFGADGCASESDLVWNGLLGADGSVSAVPGEDYVLQGRYGRFILTSIGKWEYELDSENPEVLAMKGGDPAETLTEKISYTITDGDGDRADAVLTVTIHGKSGDIGITHDRPDPGSPGDGLAGVFEENLEGGSNPDPDATTIRGSIEIGAPDGVKSLKILDASGNPGMIGPDGEALDHIPMDGSSVSIPLEHGELTVRYVADSAFGGHLEYEFGIDGNTLDHDAQGKDILGQDLVIRVEDFEGKILDSGFGTEVHDDIPVYRGGDEEHDGFVMDFGADGEADIPFRLVLGGEEIEPAWNADWMDGQGRWEFAIDGTGDLPEGRFSIFRLEDGSWGHDFKPSFPQTCDGELDFVAVDGDGDRTAFVLDVHVDEKVAVRVQDEAHELDEGKQPWGHDSEDWCEPSGTGYLYIQMQQGIANVGGATVIENGEIKTVGGVNIRIEDGRASFNPEQLASARDANGANCGIDISVKSVSYVGQDLWKVRYSYEYDQTLDGRTNEDNAPVTGKMAVTLTNLQGVVIDSGGRVAGSELDACTESVKFDIHDDMSIPINGSVKTEIVTGIMKFIDCMPVANSYGSDGVAETTSELQKNGWTPGFNRAGSQHAGADKDGVRVIGTTNKYTYDANGILDNAVDNTSKDLDCAVNVNGASTRRIALVEGKGMVVGNKGSYGGFMTSSSTVAGNEKVYGEAYSIEANDGDIYYGIRVQFTDFGENDRAVFVFYLTPQNNDDNSLVKLETVTHDMLDEDGSVTIKVPTGFTKLQLGAMQGLDGTSSQFAMANFAFTKDSIKYSGHVTVAEGADGIAGQIEWGLDQLAERLDGQVVNINTAVGAGKYELKCSLSGNTLTVTLSGNKDAVPNLDGRVIFTIEANDNGDWSVIQNYSIDPAEIFALQLPVSVTDNDGTVGSTLIDIDIHSSVDRYSSIITGYYNTNPTADGSSTKWTSEDLHDKLSDVIESDSGNDLIMSRGGDDLVLSDGGWKELLEYLEIDYEDYRIYTAKDDVGQGKTGDNKAIIDKISSVILSHKDDGEWMDRLQEVLDGLPGGNDSIIGSMGADILFGGAGDDFIIGDGLQKTDAHATSDRDIIFAGGGNDVVQYDAHDHIIHGGEGIDFLLVGKSETRTLQQMLDSTDSDKPVVRGFEVMIKTLHTDNYGQLGITNVSDLKDFDLSLEFYKDSLFLGEGWTQTDDPRIFEYNNGKVHLSLQTTMDPIEITGGFAFGPHPVLDTSCEIITSDGDSVIDIMDCMPGETVKLSGKVYFSNIDGEATLEIISGGKVLQTMTTRGGVWEAEVDASLFADGGDVQIRLSGTDMAGNPYETVMNPEFTLDLAPSVKMEIGEIPEINNSNKADDVTISGRVEILNGQPADHVTVIVNGRELGSPELDADGRWSLTVSNADLINAKLLVKVEVLNHKGEITEILKRQVVTCDMDVSYNFDLSVDGDDISQAFGRIEILKNGEPPESVEIWSGEEMIGTALVAEDGTFSFAIPEGVDARTLQARATVSDTPLRSRTIALGTADADIMGPEDGAVVFAGDGNDIVRWTDAMSEASGGRGTDIILAGSGAGSLREMTDEGLIHGFEVMLRDMDGETPVLDAEGLAALGVSFDADGRLAIDAEKWRNISNDGTLVFECLGGENLRLETTLAASEISYGGKLLLSPEELDMLEQAGVDPALVDETVIPEAIPGIRHHFLSGGDGNSFIDSSLADYAIVLGDGGKESIVAAGKAFGLSESALSSLRDYVNNSSVSTNGSESRESVWSALKGFLDENVGYHKYGSAFKIEKALLEIEKSEWNGNDVILASENSSIILGWGGDDYIEAGSAAYGIYAGSGNDIIVEDYQGGSLVYHGSISGGEGIDLYVASYDDGGWNSLARWYENADYFSGVEIQLVGKGENANNPRDFWNGRSSLQEFGITIDENGYSLILSDKWTRVFDPDSRMLVFETLKDGVAWHLETVLDETQVLHSGGYKAFNDYASERIKNLGMDESMFDSGYATDQYAHIGHYMNLASFGNGSDFIAVHSNAKSALSGDGGSESIFELAKILSMPDAEYDELKYFISESSHEKGGVIGSPAKFMYDAALGLSASEMEKRLAEIERSEWNGNDVFYCDMNPSWYRGLLLGWGGNDFMYDNTSESMVFAGSGNDIIMATSALERLSGGSGTDVLFTNEASYFGTLPALLESGEKVSGIEIVLGVKDGDAYISPEILEIYSQKDLQALGIAIGEEGAEKSLTLSSDWTKVVSVNPGLMIFESTQGGKTWHLETVLEKGRIDRHISAEALQKMQEFGIDPDSVDDVYYESSSYSKYNSFIALDDGNDFAHTNGSTVRSIISGDGGNDALVVFVRELGLESEAEALECYLSGQDESAGMSRNDIYTSVSEKLLELNADAVETIVSGIEATHPEWAGNDTVYGGIEDILIGWGGDDCLSGNSSLYVYAGGGNDIILYENLYYYRCSGGSGIDVILHKNSEVRFNSYNHGWVTGSLNGVSCSILDVEITLEALDGTVPSKLGIHSQADLQALGITTGEEGTTMALALSNAWMLESEKNGLLTFTSTQANHDWHLETILSWDNVTWEGQPATASALSLNAPEGMALPDDISAMLDEPEGESMDEILGGIQEDPRQTLSSPPAQAESDPIEMEQAMRIVEEQQG